jgi:phospholipid/cholesterol/gamma-HCH transport system substrate-binding protein
VTEDQRNYVVVGAFVAAVLAGLVIWLAVLSGRTGATDSYYVLYDNVMGLSNGTRVLYEGFPVGIISGIEPLPAEGDGRYRVGLDVRRGWRIPEDSSCRITASGLLAAVVIEISAGSSSRSLEPGSEIEGVASANLIEVVSSVAGEIAEDTPAILNSLESFTGDLSRVMARVETVLSEENSARAQTTLTNLEAASASFASFSRELDETQDRLDRLLTRVDRMVQKNEPEISYAVGDLRHTLESIAQHIDAINHNLETTSRNMSEFSRQIRQNPGVLIRGREGDDDAGGR